MNVSAPPKYNFQYTFKNSLGNLMRAYIRQHQFETRFFRHIVEKVEQIDEDTVKIGKAL